MQTFYYLASPIFIPLTPTPACFMSRLATLKFLNALINTNLPGSGKLARFLSRVLLPKAQGPLVVDTLEGFKIWVDPVADALGVENEIFRLGIYERGTVHVMKSFLRPGDNVLDVGANIGFMTLVAARYCRPGKVHAFEPLPEALEWLKKNLALNDTRNVIIHDFALGSREGIFKLYPQRLQNNRGSASLLQADTAGPALDIQVKTLDTVLDAGDSFQLMKIDVEGFELEVLKGARTLLSGVAAPAIILECCLVRDNSCYTAQELFDFITTINAYKIYKLKKGKTRISGLIPVNKPEELPHDDNIFCFLPEQLKRVEALI
jgi:FkbM family methyltransferase